MKKPANSHSAWWWAQKSIALLGTLALAGWLWQFIKAATLKTEVAALSIIQPSGIEVKPQEIGGIRKPKEGKAAESVVIPTFRIKPGQPVMLKVFTKPDFNTLSAAMSRRMDWACFVLGSDGKWGAVPITRSHGSLSSCVLQPCDPGVYLILAALPPVTLQSLKGSTSAYIQRFLASGSNDRCRAAQVLVEGKTSAKVSPAQTQETSGVIVELRQQVVNLAQPVPPPPVQPPPQPEKPANQVAAKDPRKPVEASPAISKDMKHEGEDAKGKTTAAKSPENAASESKPQSSGTKSVPSSTTVSKPEPRIKITNATLPETVLKYTPAEIKQLDNADWKTICQTHDMPFVAVPDDDYLAEYEGKWFVMNPDGTRRLKTPDDIETDYGLKCLDISAFNEVVYEAVRTQFDDATGWFKCRKKRGFLLNNLLIDAINVAMQERKDITEIGQIKKLTVSLSVHRDDSSPRIVITVESVETNQ